MVRDPHPLPSALTALLREQEGIRWQRWIEHARLVVIWRLARDAAGRPTDQMEHVLYLIDLDTGEKVETWPIHVAAGARLTPNDVQAAEDTATARIRRGFA